MQTQCNAQQFEFEGIGRRAVVAAFDGGAVSSDAGALLLSKADRALGLVERFAGCFEDRRDPDLIEHSVKMLVGQRVLGLALGYEDLIDHDELRHDPLLGAVLGKLEPRRRPQCAALAGKSTLNRLERTPHNDRYHKIAHRAEAIEGLFVEVFLDAYAAAPERIVLDLDATDDPVHGEQEGRFFHGYYGHYCYLPLYIFCDKHLLVAKLRPSNIDGAAGSLEELERVIGQIRSRWPQVEIVLRADSGFARDALMTWCEANGIEYVFGLARNGRLEAEIAAELQEAKRLCEESSAKPARLFKDFVYRTLDSWSAARRVIGKAEHLPAGANPRFIVTSLSPAQWEARSLYEELYCARGDMENRIKEQQLDLFADRTSSAAMRANQLRLWFASMAYVLLNRLRELALAGTELANATVGTIRLKLLKIGALVKTSVRRVRIAMASGYPHQEVFAHAYGVLAQVGTSP